MRTWNNSQFLHFLLIDVLREVLYANFFYLERLSPQKQKLCQQYTKKTAVKFFKEIEGISINIVFDMGFKVAIDDEKCWCPCGKQMFVWRQSFDHEDLSGEGSKPFCCVSSKMSPSGNVLYSLCSFSLMINYRLRILKILFLHISFILELISHFRKQGRSCLVHFGIAEYLHKLCGIMRETGHKELFEMRDSRYSAAEAEEKHQIYT